MHRTTILLPPDLQAEAEDVARRQGATLSELIRKQLRAVVRKKVNPKRCEDPFFKRVNRWEGPVPSDVSVNHDEYLYGKSSEFANDR